MINYRDSEGGYYYDAINDRFTKLEEPSRRYADHHVSSDEYEYERLETKIKMDSMTDSRASHYHSLVTFSNLSSSSKSKLRDLIDYENRAYNMKAEIEKSQSNERKSEERRNAIDAYKAAWRKANPLWKLFNQKRNPKKVDFGSMSVDMLENYTRRMK